jgi:hypothetical protein
LQFDILKVTLALLYFAKLREVREFARPRRRHQHFPHAIIATSEAHRGRELKRADSSQ